MLLVVLVCSLSVSLAATGQQTDDDWIDPYDMLNYDSSTKTMRKPAEKEEMEKKIQLILQQPLCSPVFMRFLRRLKKDIQRVGLPSDFTEALYDARIKLSRQDMTEIDRLLDGEDSWRTGPLDNAISQILVDLRPHDREVWRWHFEDTFGVELDTLLKMLLLVLFVVAIICTQLWSMVSYFTQFRRLFVVFFFISIFWNWFYLYKIAFAEHQNNIAKMNSVYEKCTGMKKIGWIDSLKEWFRSTFTLQDDPCKKYYEDIMVNPILMVPAIKAFTVTITTLFTEALKPIGQGISEFLVALLKDLPVTLQIPVFLVVMLCVLVLMYGSVQAAFQHGIAAPFRHPRRDPPPLQVAQLQIHLQGIEDFDRLAGGDAPQHSQRHRADDGRLDRNQVHQRRHNRPREEQAKVVVVTVRTAESPYSEDDMDAGQREAEPNLSAESDSGKQEELAGASASSVEANTAQSKTKPNDSYSSPSKTKTEEANENLSKDELNRQCKLMFRTSKRQQKTGTRLSH